MTYSAAQFAHAGEPLERAQANKYRRIAEMQNLRRTLEHLVDHCHGDQRPDCPILDDLAAGTTEN